MMHVALTHSFPCDYVTQSLRYGVLRRSIQRSSVQRRVTKIKQTNQKMTVKEVQVYLNVRSN